MKQLLRVAGGSTRSPRIKDGIMKPLSTTILLLFGLSGLFCHADTGVPLSVSTPTRPQLSSAE